MRKIGFLLRCICCFSTLSATIEAEWEYAAGGGATNRTKWAGTNRIRNLGEYAWYSSNSGSKIQQLAF